MPEGDAGEGTVLRLTRRFATPPARVFAAWTDSALLKLWWAVREDCEGAAAEVDLRAGGRYRLAMRDPASSQEYVVLSEYRTVQPPDHLTYTWAGKAIRPSRPGARTPPCT